MSPVNSNGSIYEKKRSPQKGGIRRKYLRLILIVMGVVAIVSVAINLIQMKRLSSIVNNVSEQQKDTVTFFAIDVMDTMVNRKLTNIVESEARNVDNRFGNFTSDTIGISKCVERLFEKPDHYTKQEVLPPDPSLDGKLSLQLLAVVLLVALLCAGKVSGRIVNPLETMTKRLGSIKGEDLLFEMKETYQTGDEIEVLAESVSDMSARTLQYVGQVKAVIAEKERIGAELNMATSIQASQLPRVFPPFPDREEFTLYASMDPAKEVGGDFYDFYFVDHDHIALIIADVSGKGVPAALFMMVSRVLIKSHLQSGESPGEALKNVNDQLCANNEAGLFVTVWAAVIELSTGKGISVNAGHEHPAIRRENGPFELVEYEHSLAVAAFEGIK